jgi:surface protein
MFLGIGLRIGMLGSAAGETDFVWTVATTTSSETFTIPCQNIGTFAATIDWGDGSTSAITAYNDADLAHTYASAGDHQIRISGTFPNIRFNDGGDKGKVKSVENLGVVGWLSFQRAFYGCTSMDKFVAGNTDTSSVTDMNRMFLFCATMLVPDLTGFNTSSVTNMIQMFGNCSRLTDVIGAEDFNIESLNVTTALNQFITSGYIETARYDALLINWDAQNPFDGMSPNFGASTYTAGGTAAAARANLISTDGWTITDGGTA